MRQLHELADRPGTLVSWESCGNVLRVSDPRAFAAEVCPVYFRHRNWTSFTRMMNLYSFRMLNGTSRAVAPDHARTARFVIELSGLLVFWNMGIYQPDLVAFRFSIGFRDIRAPLAQGFDLATHQYHPGFESVRDFVSMPCLAVLGRNPVSGDIRFRHLDVR